MLLLAVVAHEFAHGWAAYTQGDDTAFVQQVIRLRQTLPVLRRSRFLTGETDPARQLADVRWVAPSGNDLSPEQWDDASMRCFGLVLDGRARASGIPEPASDATVLLVLNAHHDVVNFTLPAAGGQDTWTCLLDTNQPAPDTLPVFQDGAVYQVPVNEPSPNTSW